MKLRTDRALSDKTLPGNVAVRPARPNVSINVFDDCPGIAPDSELGNKKGSHSLPLATRMRPQRRRAGRRPVVVFVRGNHLYPHGGPAVSNLLTETSQLSSRDRAVWTVSEEFALSLPFLSLSLSRISDLIIFEYTTMYCATLCFVHREVFEYDLLDES